MYSCRRDGWQNEPLLLLWNCKDKKNFNAPQLVCGGNSQFGLSPGPSHWCCGKPQVVNVSHRFVVKRPPTPAPPAKTPFQSDVQYKPQTLPSKHPTTTSRRKRGDYKEWLNCKSSICPAPHSPYPKTATTTLSSPPSPRVCELRRVASWSSTTFCPRYKDIHTKHLLNQPTLHT